MSRKLVPALSLVAAAALLVAAAVHSHGTAADPAKADKPAPNAKDSKKAEELSRFMRQKLDASNKVLEGLVTEDFALIEQGAKSMQRLSAADQWWISNDAMYRHHSAEFRRIVEKLRKKAEEKQLEGAALAWMEGTMSCIECHKWVRSMIVAN